MILIGKGLHTTKGDVMDEKNIITEYFANDEDAPATVTSIEPLTELGEHYFKVKGKDENGKFETNVFIDSEGRVLILPEEIR